MPQMPSDLNKYILFKSTLHLAQEQSMNYQYMITTKT